MGTHSLPRTDVAETNMCTVYTVRAYVGQLLRVPLSATNRSTHCDMGTSCEMLGAGGRHASGRLSSVLDGELLSSWQSQAETVQSENK